MAIANPSIFNIHCLKSWVTQRMLQGVHETHRSRWPWCATSARVWLPGAPTVGGWGLGGLVEVPKRQKLGFFPGTWSETMKVTAHFPWTFGHVESNFATGRCASVVNGLLDRGVDPTPPKYIQIFNIPWKPWDPWVGIGSWSVHFGDHIFGERILAATPHMELLRVSTT